MTSKNEEKINYLKDKIAQREQTLRNGGIGLDVNTIVSMANIKVIKEILMEKFDIKEDEWKIMYLEKDIEALDEVLTNTESIRNKLKKGLIIPSVRMPKDLKVVKS